MQIGTNNWDVETYRKKVRNFLFYQQPLQNRTLRSQKLQKYAYGDKAY